MTEQLGASYHVVDEWPGLRNLKGLDVPRTCTFDPGLVDKRFSGMAPGRLVPLLIVWLQEMERRVSCLEEERASAPSPPKHSRRPPPGWFANWAPWST